MTKIEVNRKSLGRRSPATRLAPVQVLNAVPSKLGSVAAELATMPNLASPVYFPRLLSSADLPWLRHPRPPEGRVPSLSLSGRLNLQWSLRPVAGDRGPWLQ